MAVTGVRAQADRLLIAFAEALRAEGMPVDAGRTQSFLTAVAALDAGMPGAIRWAARATLCSGPEDLGTLEQVYRHWFEPEPAEPGPRRPRRSVTVRRAALEDAGPTGSPTAGQVPVAAVASAVERLRHRDVATLGPEERAELARLLAALHPRAPQRQRPRTGPARRGVVDARATLRAQLRHAGEPSRLRHRHRTTRPRRLVLLVDVSGSMAPYADSLLRVAHVVVQQVGSGVEVFTLGTRLTRVTDAMRQRHAADAVNRAGEAVPDWSGGTRLGETLKAFCDLWGQRGMARGAVVVLASDGWERGDPALLGEQVQRLSRLAHRLVWVNPHAGKSGYQPVQGGMVAALPFVDDFLAGHSLATYAHLLEVVARA
ncbi:MAG TPA: VWA domain-containing protein [Segeticoccus sp.]|uniref:vWA domain-containing protein n=1 Tax=Segeticoccus sp. TaxID=2706531 RepID=UPI002D80E897|nr:VWA domain-containing protein [Segeticoccus sp.]HET8599699.1 VWA domain-containing protein [Segeticoccus sp.]